MNKLTKLFIGAAASAALLSCTTQPSGASTAPLKAKAKIAGHATAATTKPVMIIYGDSLTVLSEDVVNFFYGGQYTIVFRAYGGTAMCDWAGYAAGDRTTYAPARVVLAFTGNSPGSSGCASGVYGIPGFIESYHQALVKFHAAYSGLSISVVGSPAMNDQDPNRPHTNGLAQLNAMYRQYSAGGANALSGVTYNADADNGLTPGHVFRWDGPKFPGNGPIVTLRTSDGLHLTVDGQDYYGAALGE